MQRTVACSGFPERQIACPSHVGLPPGGTATGETATAAIEATGDRTAAAGERTAEAGERERRLRSG